MKVIGLTGGIASGKSTVSSLLRQLGAIVIDADVVARQVVEPDQPAWKEIVAAFGPGVLNEDRTLNRPVLGARVFNQPELLAVLNHITHPRVIERFQQQLKEIEEQFPEAVVVLDVPLLFEANMDKLADEIWVVWVSEDIQLDRLMARDGMSREEALKRIKAQMALAEKARRADRIIDNSRNLEDTTCQITRFFNETINRSGDNIEQKER
jgi:dephospho-CoA kinase